MLYCINTRNNIGSNMAFTEPPSVRYVTIDGKKVPDCRV